MPTLRQARCPVLNILYAHPFRPPKQKLLPSQKAQRKQRRKRLEQKNRTMGSSSHIQLLQQHNCAYNRPIRRRNHSQNIRRHVCKSRQTRILPLCCYESSLSSSKNGERQRNISHPHQSKSTRRLRRQNSGSRRPSSHSSAGQSWFSHRKNRRGNSYSSRWNQKKRRAARSQSLTA